VRLLDLFCGAGGATMGYSQAGFTEIVGVDIVPQPNYPFEFHQMDALEAGTYGYDFIHASPPCQPFTAYRRRGAGVGDSHEDLIVQTRALLQESGRPWVMENVPGSPLNPTFMLCGSSFGLDVRRHRWFESNIAFLAPSCDHSWQTPRFAQATNRTNKRSTVEIGVWRIPLAVQQAAMGIDWMTLRELSEAVPPAYTKWIGEQFLTLLNSGEPACELVEAKEKL
jgi:DNA (cytosine-5)-methyltransferase 1